MADYKPGSFFLTRIPGPVGWLIGVGQALAGDPARYSHAGIVISAAGDVVEAEPGGARRANLSEYAGQPLLIGDPVAWVMSLMTPEQAKVYEPVGRRAVVTEASGLGPHDGKRGVGYSPLDYLALALIHLEKLLTGRPRPTWRLTKFIRARVQSSGHMICSQLVDAVMEGAGIQLFDDGRLPGDVMPSDLAAWIEDHLREMR